MQLSMYSRGYSDILVYIGWADFFEVKVFYFNIFFIFFFLFFFIYLFIFFFFCVCVWGGGVQLKLLLFWVRDSCGYILGVTSIFDYFYGLFL